MEIEKHKAQLVAKGFSQKEGVDYTKTFSLVARMDSIQMILSIVASLNWEVHQMDVKSAFLHGDLQEEIYMQQPLGFVQNGLHHWFANSRSLCMGLSKHLSLV
jgi:hypothetical protein